MKLVTLWITRKCDAGTPYAFPELVDAWDEYGVEENHAGMEASFDKARASIGDDLAEWRVIEIDVPPSAIAGAFARPVVVAGVDQPSPGAAE